MEVTLNIFIGSRETYLGETRSVCGIHVSDEEETDYYLSKAEVNTISPLKVFSMLLPKVLDETLIEVVGEGELKQLTLILSPSMKSDLEEIKLLNRLLIVEDLSKALETIGKNKTIIAKDALLTIGNSLLSLKEVGVKISTDFKEDKVTIANAIKADLASARAYFNHLRGVEDILVTTEAKKDKKARAKSIPNLIPDKLIYNWGLPEENALPIYYSGDSTLENKKPKGEKTDEVMKLSYIYYSGDNKRLRVLGRTSGDDRYNVTILKEPNSYLETLFEHQRNVCSNKYSTVPMVCYRTANIFSAGVSNYIEEKDFTKVGFTLTGDLYSLTDSRKDLSYVFNPPRLAFKIKRHLEHNRDILLSYIGKTDLERKGIVVTDVTDYFYTKVDDKCKVHDDFTTKTKEIKFSDIGLPSGKVAKIKGVSNIDYPPRTYFSKLIKTNPKVSMLTWLIDEHIVAYGFVIETDEGYSFFRCQYGSRYLLRTVSKKNRG